MSEGGMNEEWIERIADAVVRKLDEHEQINAIARLVLHMLDQRQTSGAAAQRSGVWGSGKQEGGSEGGE